MKLYLWSKKNEKNAFSYDHSIGDIWRITGGLHW